MRVSLSKVPDDPMAISRSLVFSTDAMNSFHSTNSVFRGGCTWIGACRFFGFITLAGFFASEANLAISRYLDLVILGDDSSGSSRRLVLFELEVATFDSDLVSEESVDLVGFFFFRSLVGCCFAIDGSERLFLVGVVVENF